MIHNRSVFVFHQLGFSPYGNETSPHPSGNYSTSTAGAIESVEMTLRSAAVS